LKICCDDNGLEDFFRCCGLELPKPLVTATVDVTDRGAAVDIIQKASLMVSLEEAASAEQMMKVVCQRNPRLKNREYDDDDDDDNDDGIVFSTID
jgi:hypothetical protein